MTDRERQYISTIAQLGSITSAAKELYIAQPSLTQALRRIEGKCGVSLFQRGKKGLQLTEAGKNYLTTTEKIEKLYRQMEEEIRSAESYNDSLKLGITSFQGSLLLPEVLYAFSKKYPSVDVHLVESSSSQLELMAYKGRLDLILIHRPFREYDLNYLRSHIATVLQDDFLFSDTIGNNINLNNQEISREDLISAAKEVGAHEFIEK